MSAGRPAWRDRRASGHRGALVVVAAAPVRRVDRRPRRPGRGRCAAPATVTGLAGNGQVTVNWSAVTASPAVTNYTATSSPAGKACTVAAPATSCVVTGLVNGTPYTFTVTAKNSAGTSAASGASTVTPRRSAGGADRRDRRPRQHPGDRVVGGASIHWLGHHRLHGDLEPGRLQLHLVQPPHLHRERPGQRHLVHLHGQGGERPPASPASSASAALTPGTTPDAPRA